MLQIPRETRSAGSTMLQIHENCLDNVSRIRKQIEYKRINNKVNQSYLIS